VSERERGSTRRGVLLHSAQVSLGLGAALMGAVGPSALPASAGEPTGRRVLIDDLIDPRAQRVASRHTTQPFDVSSTLATRQPFTHVGVHWRSAGAAIQMQTSHDGLAWTPWRRVVVERTPGEAPRAPHETFGALLRCAPSTPTTP
jgi:hypothetical protein